MEIKFRLKMVAMPNYINYETPPRKREEGFNAEVNSIPVGSLTLEQAQAYAEEMKDAFMKHWWTKSAEK